MTLISSRAEYRREDYFFRREQSIAMASRQWERPNRWPCTIALTIIALSTLGLWGVNAL